MNFITISDFIPPSSLEPQLPSVQFAPCRSLGPAGAYACLDFSFCDPGLGFRFFLSISFS